MSENLKNLPTHKIPTKGHWENSSFTTKIDPKTLDDVSVEPKS